MLLIFLFLPLLFGFKIDKNSDRARFQTRAFRNYFKPIAIEQNESINKEFSLSLKWDIEWGIIDRFDIASGYSLEENKRRFIGLYFNPFRNFLKKYPGCKGELAELKEVKVRWGAEDRLIVERSDSVLILTQRFRRANDIGLYDVQQNSFNSRLIELLRCDQ